MADEVKITMTADDSNAQTAMQRQIALAKALEGQLDKLAIKAEQAASKDTGKDTLGTFAKTITAFVGVGTLVEGWRTAVSLLTAELDGALARQEKAATTFKDVAGGQFQLFANLGDDKSLGPNVFAQRQKLFSEIKRVAGATGVDPSVVQTTISESLAAKQGEDDAVKAIQFGQMALASTKGAADVAPVIAASAMRLAGGDLGITPGQATGFMLSAGTVLPLASTKDVATNLPRAISAGRLRNTNEAVTTGMYASATNMAVDLTGDKGITFLTKLFNEAREQAPEGKDLASQIDAIIADPKRAKKFYAETSWEEGFKPFVESLATGGKAYKDFKTASSKVTTFDQSEGYLKESNEALLATSPQRIKRVSDVFQTGEKLVQLDDPAEAAKDAVRKGAAKLREAAKGSAIEQRVNALVERFGAIDQLGSESEVYSQSIAQVEAQAKELRTPIPDEYYGTMMGASRRPGRQRTQQELNQAAVFQSVADDLKEVLRSAIRDGMQGANVNAQVTTDPASGSQPRASEQLQGGGT